MKTKEKHKKKPNLDLARAVITDIHKQQEYRQSILDKMDDGDEKDLLLNMEAVMQDNEAKGIVTMEKMIEMFDPGKETK